MNMKTKKPVILLQWGVKYLVSQWKSTNKCFKHILNIHFDEWKCFGLVCELNIQLHYTNIKSCIRCVSFFCIAASLFIYSSSIKSGYTLKSWCCNLNTKYLEKVFLASHVLNSGIPLKLRNSIFAMILLRLYEMRSRLTCCRSSMKSNTRTSNTRAERNQNYNIQTPHNWETERFIYLRANKVIMGWRQSLD